MTDKEKLEALEDAYYRGVRRVRYEDEEVEYQSMAEMETAIARLKAKISDDPADKRRFAEFSKGT